MLENNNNHGKEVITNEREVLHRRLNEQLSCAVAALIVWFL